ncbi:tRNA (guanine(37)-N(1))-methyltransferase [hydrothermal vent metagenome]|uniref:tRNA (guanine-N(1)-)-methyltransferase n=1 Tax=hydrothermal vent metagenome TaxID=652676 RepID=A0A3B0UV06_9ZZZZ
MKSVSISGEMATKKPFIRFHIITLFQEACESYLSTSILARAQKEKKIRVDYQNPRDFVTNKWGKVDERPYGGGPGMVMTALPVVKAVKKALVRRKKANVVIVWFTPGGKEFTNKEAEKLAKSDDIVLVAGRYEGIDERAVKMLKTLAPVKKYSTGHYVLTGGELSAMTVVDVVTRRLPGVLGKDNSIEERRISSHETYTRPEVIEWEGKKYRVPKVLKTGNHANIDAWRKDR